MEGKPHKTDIYLVTTCTSNKKDLHEMSVEHLSLFGMQFKRRLVLLRIINCVSVDISLLLSPQGHETFKRLNALAP